jgi:diguanylate cyclase (GGDEF)-like protein
MSSLSNDWLLELESTKQSVAGILLTRAEFQRQLDLLIKREDSPLLAVTIHWNAPPPLPSFDVVVGVTNELGEPTAAVTKPLSGEGQATCRISVWRKSADYSAPADDAAKLVDFISELAATYWKGHLRDEKSRLQSFQIGPTYEVANATVRLAIDDGNVMSCLFCDLDRFKAVNDTLGEAKGDDVIRQFAALLDSVAGDKAIALHRSGDEFIILFPRGDQNLSLDLALDVIQRVKAYDFDTQGITVGISAGVAVATRDHNVADYKQLEALADRALKPDGQKRRGQASMHAISDPINFPNRDALSTNLVVCVVKGRPGKESPFESPWLNIISNRVKGAAQTRRFDWTGIAEDVAKLIDDLQLSIEPKVLRSSLCITDRWDNRPIASALDIALAAANGLFNAALFAGKDAVEKKSLVVEFDKEKKVCRLKLSPDNISIMEIPSDDAFDSIDLGGFHYFLTTGDVNANDTQRVLLIKIGHLRLQIPDDHFADVLVVDDRPTRGGELPDFWESVLARVIARVQSNPNIERIYVLGNTEHAKEAVTRLKRLTSWTEDADYLSYKTGSTVSDITAVVERLRDKVLFFEDETQLYEGFATDLKSEAFLSPLQNVTRPPTERRFLERRLELGEIALNQYDGCRVATIAEAFPIVVEIARTAKEQELIRDQAGQELYELLDFRVHLTTPLHDRVPAFYKRDEHSLRDYLNRAFLDTDSLFGSRISNANQLDSVLQHLAQAIRDPKTRFATRRAILVIPHVVEPGVELTPLGLVSIRIIPRFFKQRTVLHFSFAWRTVEALVGFPYSIYGSVGYAEHLTKLIQERIGPSSARLLEMGELSYIAHSLHIFRDNYGQRIARRIVDDASL